MRADFVVVSTPSLHLGLRVVKAHEPTGVQALCSEVAVEAFDERVVGQLARLREVENDDLLIRPEVEVARDELRSLVNLDGFGIASLAADGLQRLNDVFAAIAVARVDRLLEA